MITTVCVTKTILTKNKHYGVCFFEAEDGFRAHDGQKNIFFDNVEAENFLYI